MLIKKKFVVDIPKLLNLRALICRYFNEVWAVLCADFLDGVK